MLRAIVYCVVTSATGYPSDSGRLNTLWLGGLAVFKEIARRAPIGPWGASAVSGGEFDAIRALCSCVALASRWGLLIARSKRPLFTPVSGAHHYMLGLPESDGYPVLAYSRAPAGPGSQSQKTRKAHGLSVGLQQVRGKVERWSYFGFSSGFLFCAGAGFDSGRG